MPDQIIDAGMTRSLQTDTCRTHPLVAWIVMRDPPEYPDKVTARLCAATPRPYVLVADPLAEIHAALPAGLVRSGRQYADPPEVVEIWFPT